MFICGSFKEETHKTELHYFYDSPLRALRSAIHLRLLLTFIFRYKKIKVPNNSNMINKILKPEFWHFKGYF